MLEGNANQPGEPGHTIGSYRIIRPLGSGGMSAVFLARHEVTGVEVAIKVLPREMAKKPMILRRFLREAKNAEALQHPHIAAIYDRGEERGRHYLVLEYVDGGDLHERVRADGPLDPGPALDITRTVAEGLSYAAGRGVIHRDIKPANLLVTPAGTAKIIDLGLALQTIEDDERVTRDGTTVGTVDFMAPEQARDSRGASARSDIYSLGCTLYYLVTGSPPYPGGTITEKLGRIVGEPPPDPRALRDDLPAPVARLVLRMMAKRPEDRFDDYDGLIAAIDSARADLELVPASGTFDLVDALEDDADAAEPGSFLLDDDHEEAEPDALPDAQVPAVDATPPVDAFAIEDEASPATGAVDGLPPAEISGRVRDPSTRSAIGAGLAIGLILAVFGVAVRELSRDRNPVVVAEAIPDESDGPFDPGPRPARPVAADLRGRDRGVAPRLGRTKGVIRRAAGFGRVGPLVGRGTALPGLDPRQLGRPRGRRDRLRAEDRAGGKSDDESRRPEAGIRGHRGDGGHRRGWPVLRGRVPGRGQDPGCPGRPRGEADRGRPPGRPGPGSLGGRRPGRQSPDVDRSRSGDRPRRSLAGP